jgi:IclR family transcriptional regulator, acetate operon repressor
MAHVSGPPTGHRGPESGIQSVERALDVLETIAAAGDEVTLSQLAADTAMPLTTIHRLLRTLEARGYVRRDPQRRYGLGAPLIGLGEAASRLFGSRAQPYLAELMELSGETANLALLEGEHVVYVANVPSRHRMRMFTEVGNRVLPHCTAVGKVLLAHLPEPHAERILRRSGLPRRTADTVTDLGELLDQLSGVRKHGYAVDHGEEEVGVRCVAVPVLDDHSAIAAMSVSGPQTRLSTAAGMRLIPRMQQIADRFAAELSDPHGR